MEVNKKQLADIFGASIRTIQNWQEQGMPVLRGGGKGNEVLYDSAAVIRWYAERDAEIENEKLRREVEELRQASETDLQPGTIEYERHRLTRAQADAQELKNAREACSRKSDKKIQVKARKLSAGNTTLTISDNGEGILPDVLDKIFVPFFTTKTSGSGIGLSLCKQIMTLHEGSINVKSEVGKGSSFILTFPK